uniref:Uncharacterized protein n=1 Tax=Quercus lobata TaxID=97700 RepID=A0A7N2R3N5_QUELO
MLQMRSWWHMLGWNPPKIMRPFNRNSKGSYLSTAVTRSKKWGNSEKWVLELRDGRRVVVPIKIFLPPSSATDLSNEKLQLSLGPVTDTELIEG